MDCRFIGRVPLLADVAGCPAIVSEMTARAWITGQHGYQLDPGVPFPEGYVLSDTWGASTSMKQ